MTPPADPRDALRLAGEKLPLGDHWCTDPAYVTDGVAVLVGDAIVRRAAWMARERERPLAAERIEHHLGREAAASWGAREASTVTLAGVHEQLVIAKGGAVAPFDPARPARDRLRARFVDRHGEPALDVQARALNAVLAAVGDVERVTYGDSLGPLFFWREGLLVAALMPVEVDRSDAARARLLGGVGVLDGPDPAPRTAPLAEPRTPVPNGDPAERWLPALIEECALGMGGARRPAAADGLPWVVPTHAGPLRLGSEFDPVSLLGRFAFPMRAHRLARVVPGGAPFRILTNVDVHGRAAEYLAYGPYAPEGRAGRHNGLAARIWQGLGGWALPEGARPSPRELLAADAAEFAPVPPDPPRGAILGPGARPVYVARPAVDAELAPREGRWQVLNRQRWARLPGEGSRAAAEALAARLNRVARGP